MTTWLLVDVGALAWQEFHGASRREPVAAAAGLCVRVAELAKQHGAEGRVVWCHDAGPYWRSVHLPEYKKARAEEPDAAKDAMRALLAHLPDALRALGVADVRVKRGYEADDHIAAAVAALPAGCRAVIASRDRDLLQLVGARAALYDPHERRAYGRSWFRSEYAGLHPAEWADVKALEGCSTDGVPGCPGVGTKTAVRYLAGELPRHHVAFARLEAYVGTPAHRLAQILVRLPWPGCPAPPFAGGPMPPRLEARIVEALRADRG